MKWLFLFFITFFETEYKYKFSYKWMSNFSLNLRKELLEYGPCSITLAYTGLEFTWFYHSQNFASMFFFNSQIGKMYSQFFHLLSNIHNAITHIKNIVYYINHVKVCNSQAKEFTSHRRISISIFSNDFNAINNHPNAMR